MAPNGSLPAMVVFGPQCSSPAGEDLNDLRETLAFHPQLDPLRSAVKGLPGFWHDVTQSNPELLRIPGDRCLADLMQWLESGDLSCFGHELNTLSFPLMALLQIAMYMRYLDSVRDIYAYETVRENLKHGGVQGFCLGFLPAAAFACAETEADIATSTAASIRLAVCVGVYIDLDNVFAQPARQTTSLAARWKDGEMSLGKVDKLLEMSPEAYISCINDETCVTITASIEHKDPLRDTLQANGLRVRSVQTQGRFHSPVHETTLKKLLEFCSTRKELHLSTPSVPLRSNISGETIENEPLHALVLESILCRTANWYKTIQNSFAGLEDTNRTILFIGFGDDPIPSSLLQERSTNVVPLWRRQTHLPSLKSSTANGMMSLHPTDSNGVMASNQYPPHSVAVVGMACRFAGAESVDEFWKLLLSAKSMATSPPSDRLALNDLRVQDRADIQWWGNFLQNPDTFDHRFFKKSAREALFWDPEKRLLLEVVYQALESSGYFGVGCESRPKDYGCYIGAVANNYYDNVSCHPPSAYSMLGTSRAFFSGRISHQFGFTGPSMTIDTACSSSLVAINAACKAIQHGECSRAIAGGTNVFTSPLDYQNLAAAGFLSPSGPCKPFDASADGYCRGEGVGAVVLKSLEKAMEEGDHILGVIVGSAVNQNFNDSHITVPCSASQTTAYKQALGLSGNAPEAVSYVEAHGTGTQVGDPIECQSIREAFGGPTRHNTMHFGSVKGSIGHTEAAAGVAGLIKVLLMMQNRTIPAQVGFSQLNPKIPALEVDCLSISPSTQQWDSSSRLACVNSYGAAGSNAVVVVHEGPNVPSDSSEYAVRGHRFPVVLSAMSQASLAMYAEEVLKYLDNYSADEQSTYLADIAFNLTVKANPSLPYMAAESVATPDDLRGLLRDVAAGSRVFQSEANKEQKSLVLVFGGQDSELVGLSKHLYVNIALFRHHINACDEGLKGLGFGSLQPAIFQTTPIESLPTMHAVFFAVQYATAKCWMDCGLKVDAVVGHSFGQLTALCISGYLSLQDTLKLIVGRATLMERHWGGERGVMLSVNATREKLTQLLAAVNLHSQDYDVEVACYNGPKSHVLVGSADAIQTVEELVASDQEFQDSVRVKKLNVSNGFHSKYTDGLLPRLAELARGLDWRDPVIHLETCTETESYDGPMSMLVPQHTRKPVFFEQAVGRLTQRFSECLWLEAGHGSSVVQILRACLGSVAEKRIFSSQLTSPDSIDLLSDLTVNMWKSGYPVHFWAFHGAQKQDYRFLTLPPYQFEKNRHWLPYIKTADPSTPTDSSNCELEQADHEFIAFAGYDKSSNTADRARFLIDPESERYRMLLNAHITSGQALAPVSLYIELISRAALMLHPDPDAHTTHVSRIEDLQMKTAIGLDASKYIVLHLTPIPNMPLDWEFVISSHLKSRPATDSKEDTSHTMGVVRLTDRRSTQLAQSFKRYEALIGRDKCKEILDHPDAEKMQGKHIYQAIQRLVTFGPMYQGMKSIACVGHQAAGTVHATVNPVLAAHERLYDAPLIDALMQYAGVLVNYFTHPSQEEVLVCLNIDQIETGGRFDPDGQDWKVYAVLTEDSEQSTECDVYAFDANSGHLVFTFLGFHFTRTLQSVLTRSLKDVNESGAASSAQILQKPSTTDTGRMPVTAAPVQAAIGEDRPVLTGRTSKRGEMFALINRITDIPVEDISNDSTLDDLGIDSLLVTEVVNEIKAAFGVDIDMNTFLFFPNVQAVYSYVDEQLGVSEPGDANMPSLNGTQGQPVTKEPQGATTNGTVPDDEGPGLPHARRSFDEIQHSYDHLGVEAGAVNFWRDVYPHQASLVLAYVVEAWEKLGCNLTTLAPGDILPDIPHLPRHRQLVRQLHRVLEDANLVTVGSSEGSFVRTATRVDSTPASQIFTDIVERHPKHASVHKIVQVTGRELAACLTGEKDGLQLVFGNKTNKKNLDDVYENWPLVRTGTLVLGEFLSTLFARPSRPGKFRILEIGAGTGGTTKYILDHLRRHNVPFEYVFTDLSSSLVAAAKRTFKQFSDNMEYRVMDIEKDPLPKDLASFHVVISTNCIHATRNLTHSLSNIRKMLRSDGVVALVEITRNMFWLDVAVGLFEGWWLFNDGREHAVTDERLWEKCMRQAGFADVAWSSGEEEESNTIRVIGGFA